VLDAGCGHGALCKLIIDELDPEYVVGLDIALNRIKMAKKYLGSVE
jgi:ubiquinone/menaquinone biosynthesis C-methylase UbiE